MAYGSSLCVVLWRFCFSVLGGECGGWRGWCAFLSRIEHASLFLVVQSLYLTQAQWTATLGPWLLKRFAQASGMVLLSTSPYLEF